MLGRNAIAANHKSDHNQFTLCVFRRDKMARALTKTEKKTTRRTVERDYTLYLYPKADVVLAKIATKDTQVGKGKVIITWYLFSKAVYDKYKHRKAWTWILNLGRDDLLAIMDIDYMEHYLAGNSFQYPDNEPKHLIESKWKERLDAGDYNRIALNKVWYDGMLYNPQGKPIRRAFCFDYVNGCLGSYDYDLDRLESWLNKQKSVEKVTRIEVPYYNADTTGSRALEFVFRPSVATFARMRKGNLSGYEAGEFVRKYLQVAKFRVRELE